MNRLYTNGFKSQGTDHDRYIGGLFIAEGSRWGSDRATRRALYASARSNGARAMRATRKPPKPRPVPRWHRLQSPPRHASSSGEDSSHAV